MFEELISSISNLILNIIGVLGYAGVFFLMLLESANIPVPSEIIMTFSGFLVSKGIFNFWLVVFIGALGNLVGSLINYGIAYRYGHKAEKILSKLGLMNADEFRLAENWFKRFGLFSAFIARLLPVVRTFISFPAGIFKVSLWEFSILTFAGSFLWSWVLTYLGYLAGENWNFLSPYFHQFDFTILILILVGLLWLIYHRIIKKMIR